MAVKHNAFLSLEALIKFGAIVNLKDSDGETPLHEASRLGFEDICKVGSCRLSLIIVYCFALGFYIKRFFS